MGTQMANKIFRVSIIVVGSLLAVIYAAFFISEITMVSTYRVSGTVKSRVIARGEKTLEFLSVDSTDFVGAPYPHMGDTLVTIGDSAAAPGAWSKTFGSPNPPGTEVPVAFTYQGESFSTVLRTRPATFSDLALTVFIMFLRFLIILSYLLLGFWAFSKRPDSGAVRALTLFCFAMACLLIGAVQLGIENYASFTIPYWSTVRNLMGAFSLLFGSFWLNLNLLFPSPRRLIAVHPAWAYALCYLPMAILMILALVLQTSAMGTVVIVLAAAQICAGFLLLWRRHRTSRDPLEMRQTRLVLWGSGAGLLSLAGLIIIGVISASWMRGLSTAAITAIITGVFLALLLSPLSFAYAFGRYRLLEVEGRIRRGTRHLLTSIALLAVFYLVIFLVSESLLSVLGVESRTPVLVVALTLAIGFAPAQRRLTTLLDKWFYPERVRLKGMLDEFIRGSQGSADTEAFWSGLENRLKAALKVDSVYPVVRAHGNGHFVHWQGSLTPFDTASAFIAAIAKTEGRPILRDEMEASRRTIFTAEESDWFRDHRLALILPMMTRAELVGFLGIGYKSERQDFEPADIDILKSLTSQIAVVTDNLRLLEENVEKKRMEAELSIARKVQEGMLPRDLPPTPGLAVAARSRFCTEVAGDYYDVIDMPGGRTMLAIGDVSGKGAGAALLMSNVQASLRTAVGVGIRRTEASSTAATTDPRPDDVRLADIIASINRLIWRNSQPDQFITFFAAVFDPVRGRLEYVNAGHNPPLVVRRDGDVIELTEGGLFLGAIEDIPFASAAVDLAEGDVFFGYTDGLSEAMRLDEEMFGEERIKDLLIANRTIPPDELLERLEREVEVFLGDAQLGDDFTLLSGVVLRRLDHK